VASASSAIRIARRAATFIADTVAARGAGEADGVIGLLFARSMVQGHRLAVEQ
jgi:hypothetical protein